MTATTKGANTMLKRQIARPTKMRQMTKMIRFVAGVHLGAGDKVVLHKKGDTMVASPGQTGLANT